MSDIRSISSGVSIINIAIRIVAPSVNDDHSNDFKIGSRWIDTVHGKSYVCTDNANGAAVWIDEYSGAATDATTKCATVTSQQLVITNALAARITALENP